MTAMMRPHASTNFAGLSFSPKAMTNDPVDAGISIAVLAAYAAAGPVATQMLLPALPAIQTGFAVDIGVAQLALSLSFLAMAFVQIACGAWSDRIGRRPTALWGLVIFVTGSVICLVAGNIWVLIFGRIVQGAGGAFGLVLARAIVHDLHGPTKAASMISILMMAVAVAPMLAPALGGVLSDLFDWRAIFVFTVCFGSVAFTLVWLKFRETRMLAEDPIGADNAPGVRSLLRRPLFVVHALQSAFSMGLFFVFIASAPYVVVNLLGYSAIVYGFGSVAVSLGYIMGNLISVRYAGRIGADRMMFGGTLAALVFVTAMAGLFVAGFWSLWTIFIPGALAAVALGLSLPNAQAAAINAAPNAAGVASGITGFLQLIVGAVAAQLVGAMLMTSPYPMAIGVVCLALLAFLAALMSRYLTSRN